MFDDYHRVFPAGRVTQSDESPQCAFNKTTTRRSNQDFNQRLKPQNWMSNLGAMTQICIRTLLFDNYPNKNPRFWKKVFALMLPPLNTCWSIKPVKMVKQGWSNTFDQWYAEFARHDDECNSTSAAGLRSRPAESICWRASLLIIVRTTSSHLLCK